MEKIVVSCLESRIDENQSVYSRFLLGPFLSGHAVTVATALRRALLSEVKNIAITALHIQGVTHEFSTLVGIRESVLELSLNFQQIILSTQTRTKSVQVGYLHVQGPAIVHANDLKLPDGVECVNSTQYIATLSAEGLLVVKFIIGEKKSFLKGNTSTLNNKKIKQAKTYGAKLSNFLLSHAEYDPARLFLALRASKLPNEVCTANLLSTSSLHVSSEHPKIMSGFRTIDKGARSSYSYSALLTSRGGLAPTRGGGLTNLKGLYAAKSNVLGGASSEPLEILQEQTAIAGGRERRQIDATSKVDQSANRIPDEFNSEICLRTIIPLDPIFTPVYQVNFGIERDDLSNQLRERVIMEVWTNGSIHPRQAVNEAALSIMSIFSKLRKTFHLDSHSLAIPANSTAPSVGLTRNSRLYQTKTNVKGKRLNRAVSESLEPPAAVAGAQTTLLPLALGPRSKVSSGRANRPASQVSAGPNRDGVGQRVRTPQAGDRAVHSPHIPPKLNSFSGLGFVSSRHPVPQFLQDFGKSHIRGQTFLLEQSFGLKTRFFKGHLAVFSKAKHISENPTAKRTFLPSFKLVSSSKAIVSTKPSLNGAESTADSVGSYLPGKFELANRADWLAEPLQKCSLTFAKRKLGIRWQAKVKPILFLIKYRSFCFTKNALRVFKCKQEDSLFLLPVTKQLIRLKMAGVFNSCLPLISKKSEPTFLYQVTEPPSAQNRHWRGTKLQPAADGLSTCLAPKTFGSYKIEERRRSDQNRFLSATFAPRKLAFDFVPRFSLSCRPSPDWHSPTITTVDGLHRLDVKQLLLSLAQRTNTYVPENAGFKLFGTEQGASLVPNELERREPQKRFASLIPLRGIAPLGKLWLRSNLKKQFGFLQFACTPLSGNSDCGSAIRHTILTDQAGRRSSLLARSAELAQAGCSFSCKNERFCTSALLTANQIVEPIPRNPFEFPRFPFWSQRDQKSDFVTPLGHAVTKRRCFATPLIMTKAPPLSLPSSFVTLFASPSQDYADCLTKSKANFRGAKVALRNLFGSQRDPKVLYVKPNGFAAVGIQKHSLTFAFAKVLQAISRQEGEQPRGLVKFRKADSRCVLGRPVPMRPSTYKISDFVRTFANFRESESSRKLALALRSSWPYKPVNRSSSTTDLFGFNSNGSVRLEPTVGDSCFQFTLQERLSSLYYSNLDKMSFLSSDLANLSLSLKTYTFLQKKGKRNIASLLEYSPNTLFSLLNGNEKMFHEIERCLIFLGLPFKERS